MNSRDIALAVVFAALYAVGVALLAPISFHIIQVRVADALLPLVMLFGSPVVIGITIGTLFANLFSPFGILDIVGGAFANFTATYLALVISRKIKRKGVWLLSSILQAVVITLIVGSYLFILIPVEEQEIIAELLASVIGVKLPLIIVIWVSILGGSTIAIVVIGYLLLKGLAKFMHYEENLRR